MKFPVLAYGTPRKLPRASRLEGRVVVLDIAFAANAGGATFDKTTKPFIDRLGDRLAMWIDHHDHVLHDVYRHDNRFILATKAQHGACPEMVTPERVEQAGPIDTIVCHIDFDGLCSAAKWIRNGIEPYDGADDDARAIDTRLGKPSDRASIMDRALRARPKDVALRGLMVRFLAEGASDVNLYRTIRDAATELDMIESQTRSLARCYRVVNDVAIVNATGVPAYDKTLLLLIGQERAPISLVYDDHTVTVAARFDSGIDLLKRLNIQGGMPTRVSVAANDFHRVLMCLGVDPSVM